MFKRQPLTAVSAVRPQCPVSLRVQSARYLSDIRRADRQRGQEKGSNTMRMLTRLSLLPQPWLTLYSDKSGS